MLHACNVYYCSYLSTDEKLLSSGRFANLLVLSCKWHLATLSSLSESIGHIMGLEYSKGLFYTRYNHCLHGIRVPEKRTKKNYENKKRNTKQFWKSTLKLPVGTRVLRGLNSHCHTLLQTCVSSKCCSQMRMSQHIMPTPPSFVQGYSKKSLSKSFHRPETHLEFRLYSFHSCWHEILWKNIFGCVTANYSVLSIMSRPQW